MIRPSLVLALLPITCSFLVAQDSSSSTTPSKPRIYITDSDSWQMEGNAGGANGTFAAHSSGGARPQTAEIIKTFGERCPAVIVNSKIDASDYVVRLDHEGGKGYLRKDNKVVVFVKKSGDSIFSKSTLSLGGSVKDACAAIGSHWDAHAKEIAVLPSPVPIAQSVSSVPSANEKPKIVVSSSPAGADIEINGAFVGNTPSTLEVDPGKNEVRITKKGFSPWIRVVMVKGGAINLNAELEKAGN